MRASPFFYAAAAAMFIAAFVLDLDERRRAETEKWQETDVTNIVPPAESKSA